MPIRAVAESRSFRALEGSFLDHLRVHRRSASLLARTEHVLTRLFAHLQEQRLRDIRAVSEAHLVAFGSRLALQPTAQGRPRSPCTQALYLCVVKRFFAFLESRAHILYNPARELPLPKLQALPRRVLSEAQVRRLLAAPFPGTSLGRRDIALLETLYGTGIRLGECVRLVVVDLDLSQGTLLVRNGKGRKDRFIPVCGRAAAALDVYLRDVRPDLLKDPSETALFLDRSGKRLGRAGVKFLILKHGKTAGIPFRVTAHALRHGCATHLLRGGADLRHVQELLGHRSIKTTTLYTKVTMEDLRQLIARAHPRERTISRRRPGKVR